MFEEKKYLSKKTLTKLRDSNVIKDFIIVSCGYVQRLVSNNQVVYRQLLPVIDIRVNHLNGDVEVMKCLVLKNSYRIQGTYLNGVLQSYRQL